MGPRFKKLIDISCSLKTCVFQEKANGDLFKKSLKALSIAFGKKQIATPHISNIPLLAGN
jgi:hypothetical protein